VSAGFLGVADAKGATSSGSDSFKSIKTRSSDLTENGFRQRRKECGRQIVERRFVSMFRARGPYISRPRNEALSAPEEPRQLIEKGGFNEPWGPYYVTFLLLYPPQSAPRGGTRLAGIVRKGAAIRFFLFRLKR